MTMELSVEFFPPKTETAEQAFWPVAKATAALDLDFISVTYGAGGSTKENSMRIASSIQQHYKTPVSMHLTCVDADRETINTIAQQCWDKGIKSLVALRGDPKTGVGTAYVPHPNGYAYASDLVEGLKKIADFDISVAAYPEKHPEAASLADDIIALKKKQDAGASRALTQFFFNNEDFLRFKEQAVAQGVTMPIIPGLLPIHNVQQTLKFATACGAVIPDSLLSRLEDVDKDAQATIAKEYFLQQCHDLKAEGVDGFHFYGMNRVEPVAEAVALLRGTTCA